MGNHRPSITQSSGEIAVATHGRGLYEVTGAIAAWLAARRVDEGLLTLFLRHTSASLLVQENADPSVQRDLEDFFAQLAPEAPGRYAHATEGPDDMPAHIRAALTLTQLSVPVRGGRMALGTWQGIYVFEHRTAPHERRIALHLLATPRGARDIDTER